MRLYIVRYPNKVQLHWAATQAEAKAVARDVFGTWQALDIPTDKPGLLAFLNEVEAPASRSHFVEIANARAAEVRADIGAEAQPATPAAVANGRCPRCASTPEAAAKIADGMSADAFVERVLEAPHWFVARIFEALAQRATGAAA